MKWKILLRHSEGPESSQSGDGVKAARWGLLDAWEAGSESAAGIT